MTDHPNGTPSRPRILFLGRTDVIGLTRHFATLTDAAYFRQSKKSEVVLPGMKPLRLRDLWRLRKELRAGRYDLVIACANDDPVWRIDRSWFANLRKTLTKFVRWPASLAFYLVPWMLEKTDVPLAVYEWDDNTAIARKNWGLLQRATLYFKTQMPRNPYKAFFFQDRRNDDLFNIIRQPRFVQWAEKMRPYTVGISVPENWANLQNVEKKTDIFFAGPVGYSFVRAEGLRQLEALREQGYIIDLVVTDKQPRLSSDEFLRRCAEAWLSWSPEGAGWDCARHYWAPLMGSVPLLNHPDTRRHRPLLDGVHAFYYGVEDDDLQRVARLALADKARLRQMAAAGEAHVRANHTLPALADYLINETLAKATAGKDSPQPA
jgi:hypothetical protein